MLGRERWGGGGELLARHVSPGPRYAPCSLHTVRSAQLEIAAALDGDYLLLNHFFYPPGIKAPRETWRLMSAKQPHFKLCHIP